MTIAISAAAAQACSESSRSDANGADAGVDAWEAAADVHVETPPRGRNRISETGLYVDVIQKTVASDAIPYEPAYALWSDGATKKRWIRLPAGTSIDATDPDHFVLPVGAQLFKEFSLGGKRLETRLVERLASTGNDEKDYFMGAFVWRDDESDADWVKPGASNVRGTPHDVPSSQACWTCHLGEPGHALGFSARQLSHDRAGLNLAAMRDRGAVPASVREQAISDPAAGYLHTNCGHCHNMNGVAWPDTDMTLRLGYGETDLASSLLVRSTVNVPLRSFHHEGYSLRIDPGAPATSAVLLRMSSRGDGGVAMPPIATEEPDPAGIEQVRAFIAALQR